MSAAQEITGRTLGDLKAALRKAMGWPDRRSWKTRERREVEARFDISIDFSRKLFIATPKPGGEAAE